jgi:hypothetical protein
VRTPEGDDGGGTAPELSEPELSQLEELAKFEFPEFSGLVAFPPSLAASAEDPPGDSDGDRGQMGTGAGCLVPLRHVDARGWAQADGPRQACVRHERLRPEIRCMWRARGAATRQAA